MGSGFAGGPRGTVTAGDAAVVFVRPEAIVVARDRARLPGSVQSFDGDVESLLFDGANSAVLVREAATRIEFRIALPQAGEFADLRTGERVAFGFDPRTGGLLPRRGVVIAAARMAAPDELAAPRARLALLLLLAPALLWLVGLIVLPHIELAYLSLRARVAPRVFEWSLAQYGTFFEEPLYWRTFVRTAAMSIAATLATFAIAFPAAWYIAKIAKGRAKSLLFVLCLIPFWVSETVRTLGWMILLRESGVLPRLLVDLGLTATPVELLYHDATILVGLVYTSMLFMVVPLVNALETLDDSLIEAAYDLGGSGWSILRQIVIPHAMPGITAGAIVVFMLTLGNYLTPTLLGGKNSLWFTELIYTQFITRFNWEQGAAFGFLLLGLSTAIVWCGLQLTGQRFTDVMRRS